MDKLGEATFEVKTKGKRGRVVRCTGRKDRHSKVCTARGTRDRRVRLSPHTAIHFYDLQDRLGCDRPSKAIDWLMSEAKPAIDALNRPPTHLFDGEPQPDYDYQHYLLSADSEIVTTFSLNYGQDYSSAPLHYPPPSPEREPLQSTYYPQFQGFGFSHPDLPNFRADDIPFLS